MKQFNLTKQTKQIVIVLLGIFLSSTTMLFAQSQITVSGTVIDDQNQPLAGVNVLVQGTSNGTQTDFDGNYIISADSNATLVFSYLGFAGQEVPINGQTTINVSLVEDTSQLDEVVVIGYGTQRKSDLTGAVGILDGEELNKFTSANVTQSLQGRVAGVQIQNNGGAPGANAFITIRGQSTLSNAGPLFVVDGLQVGNIQNLNPADIESISVLKDASAAAIYGQRAANGVIIVTTKKGKAGRIAVDVDFSFGFDQIINQLDFLNARQYADYRNQANDNDGTARAPANDTQFNPNIDTEIQDASLRSGPIFNANARVSGGNENGSYSVSLNRLTQDGIVKQSSFERNNLRVNTVFNKGRFRFEQNLNIGQTKNQENNFFNRERDHIPTAPIFAGINGPFDSQFRASAAPDGNTGFHGIEDVTNSLGLAELEENLITTNSVQGNIIASFEIIDGLVYKLNAGLDFSDRNNFRFTPTYFFAQSNTGANILNRLDERNFRTVGTLVENTLSYTKEFNKHRLNVLVGFTEQRTTIRSLGAIVTGLPSNDIRVASAGANIQEVPSEETLNNLQSYIGRLDYAYDDRYSLTATIRRDGSSLFLEDLRFGNFISVGGAWNVINESFMDQQNLFDDFKFRVGYGETGSNNIEPFATAFVLNTNSGAIDGNGNRNTGFAITRGVNPELQWETTETTNFGLELGFLDNSLRLEADYFVRNSRDILVGLPPVFQTGFNNSPPANAASIRNRGFELLATYRTQIGKLNLDFAANFSTVSNEVIALGENVSPIQGGGFTSNGGRNTTRTEPGQPVSSFYLWRVLGIYQTDEEAIADGRTDGAGAGDFRFEDFNGDGVLNEDDRQFLGNPAPDFTYGLNIGASYKNWDLTAFFNGVQGNDIINGSRWRFTFDTTSNYFPDVLNAWTPSNTNTNIPRATLADPANNGRQSDFLLEDGSYLRLRNLQIGYSLPENIASTLKMAKARIYVSATNLLTITGYRGFDPEVGRGNRGNNINIFNAGVDEAAYPSARTLQIGAQISF